MTQILRTEAFQAQPLRPRRSLLFIPAANGRALEKARGLGCDGIIIDLEDAVAPAMKETAREQAHAAITAGFGGREVALRINGIDTPWFADDLAFAALVRPNAIVIPKTASPETIRLVVRKLAEHGAPVDTSVWAMIETARAVLDADAIARTAQEPENRLDLLLLGTNDLARETGVRPTPHRAALLPWLQHTLLAARASGLAVIDAVYNDFSDAAGFAAECEQGRNLGFDGKALIHPAQIDAANRTFGPSDTEIADAHALISAYEAAKNTGKGAVAFKGRMIEELHADMARKTLALAHAVADLHGPMSA